VLGGLCFGVLAHNAEGDRNLPETANSTIQSSTKQTSLQSSIASSTTQSSSSAPQPSDANWIEAKEENYLPTLMYHQIVDGGHDNNVTSPATFESQLKALKDAGYYTVTPAEAYEILTTNKKPAQKMVWLTFDDGAIDFYNTVYPLLKKYNMKATSFLVTGEMTEASHFSVAQMKEMAQSGLVSFESHTQNHRDLSTLNEASQMAELKQSKEELDRDLGQNTTVICYPSGKNNEITEKVAKELGYKLGLTVNYGYAANSDGLFKLARMRMFPTTTAEGLLSSLKVASDRT
jgi:peptidoglycan/xylan/chitin deacetylase (PgdA/CDA1 family)